LETEELADKKTLLEEGLTYDNYVFRVTSDKMLVLLETPLVTREDKREFLENYPKIKEFLISQGIQFVLEEPEELDGKLIVAMGHPPREGQPERIEFLPKFERLIKKTEEDLIKEIPEDEEKAEDLREKVQKILCVKEGEAIAKWHPLTPPTPGINIFGEEVQPPPLKEEKNFELSDNVYLDEKERLIKAKISGVVTFEKGKIDVLPEYVLKGDVDFSVGNIYFYGKKLTIQGDVKFGFKVIVEGDLELRGCTENKVKIEVKGNFIAEGVIRGEDTTVEVWGEAKIRGAEFAKILVHGNLYVKDYLVFTDTLAEGDLIAIEGKGLIYGGEVRAIGNVEVKIVGHAAQTLTIIGAGYYPDIVNDYLVTIERIEVLNEFLKKIDDGLKLASKLKEEGRLTEEKLKYVEKLINERKRITEEIARLEFILKDLSTKLTEYRNKNIKIQQKIFPNVILRIAEFTYTNNEELNGPIVFYLDVTEIKYREGGKC
jgi:uncharacterized protein (DUF342 family)